jgi:hypothetical protein
MASSKHLLAGFALALAACTPPAGSSAGGDSSSETSSDGFSAPYEIFAGDRALELTEQCSRISPGPAESTWTPSDTDIRAMEPALLERLRRELVAIGWEADPSSYVRQYGGLVIGNRRVIYTHGFTLEGDDPDEGWRTHAHTICDGGPITFGVEYEPTTRRFANFAFNGPFGPF